ncbi:hypothetical protein [Aurantiacibacter aquimixticola]|uniref:Glycosyltransferase family 92 protein n=1 Tax=Aurantiacibacter aquimixticola TaxID=1958945 RepID=A0A419RVU4_9SPHN|nr:hypothetical protein [Aurantiacibacter aquimixticola]RJY09899.1 hypothetical protein D6201_11535 [Aurantiacibacter aquimixticola]
MTPDIRLTPAIIQTDIVRDAPRPPELRSALYAERFDWKTLFYDVYRCGRHVVLQGPPFLNLLGELRQSDFFNEALGGWLPAAHHYGRKKRGEIWLRSDATRIAFDSPLGRFDLGVQPSHHDRFAGKRMLLTLSKDNEVRWIVDWARFHRRLHGADALLFYDNGSSLYEPGELQARLSEALPAMDVLVLSWPYPYGPQAGPNWAVDGVEPDWDSDFCQVGVLQHARFRFLQKARSVMHNDVDELVIAHRGRSVFTAAEASRTGMVKFDGRWISVHAENGVDPAHSRHADFRHDEGAQVENSPPKWCLRPSAFSRSVSWGVHNIFGAKGNDAISDEFLFRHFRGITTNWNYQRWNDDAIDTAPLIRDERLVAACAAAGLEPGRKDRRAA